MKRIINILIWGLISIAVLLVGIRYLYLGINKSALIYGIMGLIAFIAGGVMIKETIAWIRKTD